MPFDADTLKFKSHQPCKAVSVPLAMRSLTSGPVEQPPLPVPLLLPLILTLPRGV